MTRCFLNIVCLFTGFSIVICYDKLLVDELRTQFLHLEDDLWKYVLKDQSENNVDPGMALIKKFYEFDKKVQQMPQDILYGMQVVRQAYPFLLLYSDMRVIHDMYDKFRRYQRDNLSPSPKDFYSEFKTLITTGDIVNDILHDVKNNVNNTVTQIFENTFVRNDGGNMIWEVFEIVSANDYKCKNTFQPSQQVFYNLYNAIALIELKGYIMTQFAYLAQRLQEPGNNTASSLAARKQYKIRVINTTATLKGAIEITNGKLWRCDPKYNVEGETYEQITRLLQGHIQNEVDMNNQRTCTKTCDEYVVTSNHGCYDSDSAYCRYTKPCNGILRNCRFVESDFSACISPSHSLRRYEYVRYESGKTLGHKSYCSNHGVYSWNRWFVHCSYCLCLCDQRDSKSDRYFNIRPVMADVANNRVVTGLRMIKHNRIIHLQIQEGKLLPYGYIDNSTVRWVPVDDYKVIDRDVRNGQDYHTLEYDRRSLLLDDLSSHEPNDIVTGVRFEYLDGHLRFQINVRPFDFKTGIFSNGSYYVFGAGTRMRINMDSPDVPTKSPQSKPVFDADTYVEFTYTDFDKDMAQTTVPFIDIQPVMSHPQVPLKGAGIYYKGKKGFGGFIAPKITTYDFKKHLDLGFPDAKIREDSQGLGVRGHADLETMVISN